MFLFYFSDTGGRDLFVMGFNCIPRPFINCSRAHKRVIQDPRNSILMKNMGRGFLSRNNNKLFIKLPCNGTTFSMRRKLAERFSSRVVLSLFLKSILVQQDRQAKSLPQMSLASLLAVCRCFFVPSLSRGVTGDAINAKNGVVSTPLPLRLPLLRA